MSRCPDKSPFIWLQEKITPNEFQEMAGYKLEDDWSLTISLTHLPELCSLKAWLEQEAGLGWTGCLKPFSEECHTKLSDMQAYQGIR